MDGRFIVIYIITSAVFNTEHFIGLLGAVLISVLKAEPGPGPDRYNQVRSRHCIVKYRPLLNCYD